MTTEISNYYLDQLWPCAFLATHSTIARAGDLGISGVDTVQHSQNYDDGDNDADLSTVAPPKTGRPRTDCELHQLKHHSTQHHAFCLVLQFVLLVYWFPKCTNAHVEL